jgi:hypothetical protein
MRRPCVGEADVLRRGTGSGGRRNVTELNGTVLAQPERLTDFTFKAVHA